MCRLVALLCVLAAAASGVDAFLPAPAPRARDVTMVNLFSMNKVRGAHVVDPPHGSMYGPTGRFFALQEPLASWSDVPLTAPDSTTTQGGAGQKKSAKPFTIVVKQKFYKDAELEVEGGAPVNLRKELMKNKIDVYPLQGGWGAMAMLVVTDTGATRPRPGHIACLLLTSHRSLVARCVCRQADKLRGWGRVRYLRGAGALWRGEPQVSPVGCVYLQQMDMK
jgi:hypothetical protein